MNFPLYRSHHGLTGTIPSWIADQPLQLLSLSVHCFQTRSPNILLVLSTFMTEGCMLVCSLTPCSLSNLAHNRLTGTIPSWIGDLGSLSQLYVVAFLLLVVLLSCLYKLYVLHRVAVFSSCSYNIFVYVQSKSLRQPIDRRAAVIYRELD